MSETADGAGRGLLMSRGHVWHEHALRRACNATRMLHELQQRLEKRLRDDTAAAEPSGKKRRLFEEYQGLQWALEALAPMEAANAERKAKHEARSREIAAEMSKLDAELAYCKVRCDAACVGGRSCVPSGAAAVCASCRRQSRPSRRGVPCHPSRSRFLRQGRHRLSLAPPPPRLQPRRTSVHRAPSLPPHGQ